MSHVFAGKREDRGTSDGPRRGRQGDPGSGILILCQPDATEGGNGEEEKFSK